MKTEPIPEYLKTVDAKWGYAVNRVIDLLEKHQITKPTEENITNDILDKIVKEVMGPDEYDQSTSEEVKKKVLELNQL